jgi:hypothetical protein
MCNQHVANSTVTKFLKRNRTEFACSMIQHSHIPLHALCQATVPGFCSLILYGTTMFYITLGAFLSKQINTNHLIILLPVLGD